MAAELHPKVDPPVRRVVPRQSRRVVPQQIQAVHQIRVVHPVLPVRRDRQSHPYASGVWGADRLGIARVLRACAADIRRALPVVCDRKSACRAGSLRPVPEQMPRWPPPRAEPCTPGADLSAASPRVAVQQPPKPARVSLPEPAPQMQAALREPRWAALALPWRAPQPVPRQPRVPAALRAQRLLASPEQEAQSAQAWPPSARHALQQLEAVRLVLVLWLPLRTLPAASPPT